MTAPKLEVPAIVTPVRHVAYIVVDGNTTCDLTDLAGNPLAKAFASVGERGATLCDAIRPFVTHDASGKATLVGDAKTTAMLGYLAGCKGIAETVATLFPEVKAPTITHKYRAALSVLNAAGMDAAKTRDGQRRRTLSEFRVYAAARKALSDALGNLRIETSEPGESKVAKKGVTKSTKTAKAKAATDGGIDRNTASGLYDAIDTLMASAIAEIDKHPLGHGSETPFILKAIGHTRMLVTKGRAFLVAAA